MRPTLLALPLLAFTLCAPALAQATDTAPKGWFLAGDQPQSYRTGVDPTGSAFLASTSDTSIPGFGTLMQRIQATNYAGKRVRFRASVRSENVHGWAGLWMRVDKGKTTTAFDNMQTRAIKGTTGWNTYDVVLDVPPDATSISFGTLMADTGEVWLNHVTFEVVSTDVPTTDTPQAPQTPVNLDFRQ